MAYIIPNATDTTSDGKYAVLDQAEPDSIDFEILGNDRSGVVSGCAVRVAPSGGIEKISVDSGAVAVNGVIYQVAGDTALSIPVNPSGGQARFDLVVARLQSGAIVLTVIAGTPSSTNPVYPGSVSRLISAVNVSPSSVYNPDTDVVLAAVYRQTSIQAIANGHIVDKRKTVQTPISYRGPGVPEAGSGSVGDLYLKTTDNGIGESGLYIKRPETGWKQLASVPIDPGVPVGTVITWVAPADPNSAVWVECNGAEVSRVGQYNTLYNLFEVNGSCIYGDGDGSTTFRLPDFRGVFLAGLPSAGATLASRYGNNSNQVTLTEDQIPGHTHIVEHTHTGASTNMSGSHAHTSDGGSHVHAMDHSHGQGSTSPGGAHAHQSYFLKNANNTGPNHYLRPMGFPTDGVIDSTTTGGAHSHSVTIPAFSGFTGSATTGTGSSPSGEHSHSVSIPASTVTSKKNRETTPTAINIQPYTMHVRYFIRYA